MSKYVQEAELMACSLLEADEVKGRERWERITRLDPDLTLVERLALEKNISAEEILRQFARPMHAPIMDMDTIQLGRDDYYYEVEGIPALVVNMDKGGAATAVTPVVMLDKTDAPRALRDAYGAIRMHMVIISPRQYREFVEKMKESGKYHEGPPEEKAMSRQESWKFLMELECATIPCPDDIDLALTHLRGGSRKKLSPDGVFTINTLVQNLPFIDFKVTDVQTKMSQIPIQVQKDHRMTPISLVGESLCAMGMSRVPTPQDKAVMTKFKGRYSWVLCRPEKISMALTEWEARKILPSDIARRVDVDTSESDIGSIEEVDITEMAADGSTDGVDGTTTATIASFTKSIFLHAVRSRATDIHILTQPDAMLVRFRIDGMISKYPHNLPSRLTRPVITRIKHLCGLNTQATSEPLEGKFHLKIKDQQFDVRVQIMVTGSKSSALGELAVLRLLERNKRTKTLHDLGFRPHEYSLAEMAIASDHGMLVVCGPTGSGKSTTLAACIGMLNTEETAVVSGEQPIEREIPNVAQTEITWKETNPNGLSYPKFLESAMRLDPDYVNIGEIRDEITARMAVRAAMTGHGVFTTLHANSAAAAPGRLIDMGVVNYFLVDALKVVMAQRILAQLCPVCAVPAAAPDDETLKTLGIKREWFEGKAEFMARKGCPQCRNTGYYERTAIVEGFYMDDVIVDIIRNHNSDAEMIEAQMIKQDGKTLYMQACALAARGVTDLAMATTVRS